MLLYLARLLSALILLLAASSAPAAEAFVPLWTNAPGHITDLVLIYQGGTHRLPWSEEEIAPYVSWQKAGAEEQWLFDGFLFIEFMNGQGREYASGYTRRPAGKTEWQWLLDRNFSATNGLGALERAVAAAQKRIGAPPQRRKVVLTLPEPIHAQTNWGVLNERALDFHKFEDRVAACEWHIDTALARWRKWNPQHLELAGFYWVAEHDAHAREILPAIGQAIRKRDLRFYWIPYWKAGGAASWRQLGFDYAWQQPNHFFHPDKVPDARLGEATAFARQHGLGLEFEADARAIRDAAQFRPRFYAYLDAFRRDGVKTGSSIAYYEGGGALLQMARSDDPPARALYDDLALWISERQQLASKLRKQTGPAASSPRR